ncbi:MAG: serine/threonine protein kinase [Phycisphaerae bacterium]|nr:serine/threonine protein kinase [Phycisphaerae bacterium]
MTDRAGDSVDSIASLLADDIVAQTIVPVQCPHRIGPEGRYELLDLLVPTHRAAIYLAIDRTLSTPEAPSHVIVKIVANRNDLEEAQLARRVRHPNVVEVYDAGVTEDGLAYVVTEYVPRGDLRAEPVPARPSRAAEIVRDLADAVHAAHAVGVVHSDIKPANVLLANDGTPKLADFDLAKDVADGDAEIRGTLITAAPEQLGDTARSALPLSDVYGLAGLLFWLLTGVTPNAPDGQPRSNHLALLETSRVPSDLRDVCLRSLQADPLRRHGSARELSEDLSRWLADTPIPWRDVAIGRRLRLGIRRHPLQATLVFVAALAIVGLVATVFYFYTVDVTAREAILRDQIAYRERESKAMWDWVRGQILILRGEIQLRAPSAAEEDLVRTMVWLERIGELPGPDGKPVRWAKTDVAEVLNAIVVQYARRGEADSLLAAITSYAYALSLESSGALDAANAVLDDLDVAWTPRLKANDPFLARVRQARERVQKSIESGDSSKELPSG